MFSLTRNLVYLLLLGCSIVASWTFTFFDNQELIPIIVSLLCAGISWYVLKLWEKKMRRSVSKLLKIKMQTLPKPRYQEEIRGYQRQIEQLQTTLTQSDKKVGQLNLNMDKKLEEMRMAYLEFEDLRKEYHRLENDHQEGKAEAVAKLKHKEALINEYQRTISEQRKVIEKKQRYIGKLEGKVRDLMYEIRSLLQLEEPHEGPAPPIDLTQTALFDYYLPSSGQKKTLYDLSLQLQGYLQKAENFTGAEHLGYIGGKSPRFHEIPLNSNTIDQRRLFDSFREETTGIIFIYSQREKKFVFVNHYIKTLLGWSPEKFMKEFPHFILKGYPEWKTALINTNSIKETQTQLMIQNKSGKQQPFNCHMGRISKGPFVNHIIGILSETPA